jgi:hypothetical protein
MKHPSLGPDQMPTLQDFHKMKYIRMVIKETLRVHHPCKQEFSPSSLVNGRKLSAAVKVGYNARVPIKDMTLPRGGGPDGKSPVAVLKETQICEWRGCLLAECGWAYTTTVYSLLSMQRRKDLGVEDVDVWRPERWGTCTLHT